MLLIKTKLSPSRIAGIGLFAVEYVPKGTLVWQFHPDIDLLLCKEQIKGLSPAAQEQFHNYAFLDKKYNKYMLCGDDGRFFNHSDRPNCDDSNDDITIALRDILPGEELTVDYRSFYGNIDEYRELIKAV